jgi:hypothetical protein
MDHEPTIAQLKAEADYTRSRVDLYTQKIYAGRGEQRRLAELQRVAEGAEQRLRRAQDRAAAD